MSGLRVALFSERLGPPFDEGIKNVAANLLSAMIAAGHDVLGLTTGGSDVPELRLHELGGVNRLLLDRRLAGSLRRHRTGRVVYLPTASMTLAAFARARVLGMLAGAPVSLVALQPRTHGPLARRLIASLAPERVLVQSRASADRLAFLGRRVRLEPAGVDAARFRPVSAEERARLRQEYGFRPEETVILHAGHVVRNRNVAVLADLQELPGARVVLAGSQTTQQDLVLLAELRAAGVQVIDQYLPHIEQLYALADLYVFPPSPATSAEQTPAIEVPLSVLEAMACDLPLVATRFGGLPALFAECAAVRYIAHPTDAGEWRSAARLALAAGRGHTRGSVQAFGWDRLARAALATDG
jgi:glycosyltransferase involved in cell wall biosynthesis